MQHLVTHVVPHASGDKRLELHRGDLAALTAKDGIDLLVVSAFPDNYLPSRRSLIGALARRGLSVRELAKRKEADLRAVLSCWLSPDLSAEFPDIGFRRLVCFEASDAASPAERVGDIFRAIMPFCYGEPAPSVLAMPLLGTGDQGYDPALMLAAIFEAATRWLEAGLPLQTIKLVLYDEQSLPGLEAEFRRLSDARTRAAPLQESAASEPPPWDVFVSYAHADGAAVDLLVAELGRQGPRLRVFQDKLELDAGHSWQVELDRALESCRCVIPVYSPAYLASKMCIEEFNMARVRHRESPTPVLRPIFLLSAALPLYMRSIHYLDCREADRERLAAAALKLTRALAP